MCISIPGKVIIIKKTKAKIEQGDHCHWVDISSLQERVREGDYLIAYQGTAINKVPKREAKEILKLMNSAGDARVKSPD